MQPYISQALSTARAAASKAGSLRIVPGATFVRQLQNFPDGEAHFLRLYRPDNVDGCVIASDARCLPELDQRKDDADHHGKSRHEVQGRGQTCDGRHLDAPPSRQVVIVAREALRGPVVSFGK